MCQGDGGRGKELYLFFFKFVLLLRIISSIKPRLKALQRQPVPTHLGVPASPSLEPSVEFNPWFPSTYSNAPQMTPQLTHP